MVVALLAGIAGTYLAYEFSHHSLIGHRWAEIELMAAWAVAWVVVAHAAQRLGRRWGLVFIVALAIVLRVASFAPYDSISNDTVRYAWDAHVQLSGVDPYRYPPDAPQLRYLRVGAVFPSPHSCELRHRRPGCASLNRPSDRTIYPPVAEGWFDIVHLLSPGDYGDHPWQFAGAILDMATVGLLAYGLRSSGHDPRRVAWYALCPVPVIELTGNGHIDSLALLLQVAAILALQRRRPAWAGLLLGAAIMVKLYPAVAVVAFWRTGRWRMLLPAAAVVIFSELPHVLAVGSKVLGYLPGYLHEERYSSGGRFLLVGLTGAHGDVAIGLVAAFMVAAVLVVYFLNLGPALGTAALLAVLMLLATPVQPWYAVTLGGVGMLVDAPWLLLPALAAEPYYAAVILHSRDATNYGRLAYGLAALGIAVGWALRSRRAKERAAAPAPLS
jgi:hypothetical protein